MKKRRIASVLLVLLCVQFFATQPNYDRHNYFDDSDRGRKNISKIDIALAATAGVALSTLAVYSIARGLHSYILYRYDPELDMLARAAYNETIIQEELIPYILERHDRNNSLYFFMQGKYKNYPLLYYKITLDWYINRLWLSSFLYFDSQEKRAITILLEKLERIRRSVVTDYRFVEEQRDFDRRNKKDL